MAALEGEKVVIVGFGWVGQANALALAELGYDVFSYDILPPRHHYTGAHARFYNSIKALKTPLEIDGLNTTYLVCVGDRVSEEGVQDVSYIRQALESLKMAKGTVILRSTIVPKTLTSLTFDYYMPEFLHEKFAIEECIKPFYFVLGRGTRNPDSALPSFVDLWRERAQKVFEGSYEEASFIKYFSNMWNAVRIAFVNELGDAVAAHSQARTVEDVERVINFLFERKSYLRYGKEFGGHCLPKDMRAFLNAYKGDANLAILEGTYASNTIHAAREKTKTELPQLFSAWDYDTISQQQKKVFALLWRGFYFSAPISAVRKLIKPLIVWVEGFFPERSHVRMRDIWEQKAKENARLHVNPRTQSGELVDESELERTGREDYEYYVSNDPILLQHIKLNKTMRALDFGVGIGRMSEFFANHFAAIHGVDISPTMIQAAKGRLASRPEAQFAVLEGTELPYPDKHFDFVFSYQTFQHIDSTALIAAYLREIGRTLKPGGVAKVQLRTGPGVRRWMWSYGVSFKPEEAAALAEHSGLKVLGVAVEDSKKLWLLVTPQ